jgi:hypothetical protein
MSLAEIEAAAEALPPEEKQELYRFLASKLHLDGANMASARLVRENGDVLLEAPVGAPVMTPEVVKRILRDWP